MWTDSVYETFLRGFQPLWLLTSSICNPSAWLISASTFKRSRMTCVAEVNFSSPHLSQIQLKNMKFINDLLDKAFERRTHFEVKFVGCWGRIIPSWQLGHIAELVWLPSSVGSKHLLHWQVKYHWDCTNCCLLMVPNWGVVYLVVISSPFLMGITAYNSITLS